VRNIQALFSTVKTISLYAFLGHAATTRWHLSESLKVIARLWTLFISTLVTMNCSEAAHEVFLGARTSNKFHLRFESVLAATRVTKSHHLVISDTICCTRATNTDDKSLLRNRVTHPFIGSRRLGGRAETRCPIMTCISATSHHSQPYIFLSNTFENSLLS
jgi:hypothetical protein